MSNVNLPLNQLNHSPRFFFPSTTLFIALLLILLTRLSGHSGSVAQSQTTETTTITVSDTIIKEDVKRLGINIGSQNRFGAAQILKNIVVNPGFEAGEYAMIFNLPEGESANQFQADFWDTNWNNDQFDIGQPIDFWTGGEYRVLSGGRAGESGEITRFEHVDDRYTFVVAPANGSRQHRAKSAVNDAVAVYRQMPGYLGDQGAQYRADTTTVRPGSSGTQSLLLQAEPTDSWSPAFAYYLDSIDRDADPTAGRMLNIEGEWQLEIWAKGGAAGEILDIYFSRQCDATYFYERILLTADWAPYTVSFDDTPDSARMLRLPAGVELNPAFRQACDPTINGPLELGFRVPFGSQDAWVDDVALYKAGQTNPTVFSDSFVEVLKEYKPGILRDWGHQLGSSLDNQLADPFARKTTNHRPHDRYALNFHYSLHEFLELAAEVGAEPWYVIPPTFSNEEMANLAAYLAAPAGAHPYADRRAELGQSDPWTTVFTQIHLEFGNEMWGANAGGDPFIGATLRGGTRIGEIGGSRFTSFKAPDWVVESDFNFILGGQFEFPNRQSEIEASSQAHDTIALSPYFGTLRTYANDAEIYYPLFAGPTQDVTTGPLAQSAAIVDAAGKGTDLAVYEINFHTTTGNATLDVRNRFVSGLAGGLALPLHMLTNQKVLGINDQAAFTILQYAHRMDNGEYVRLWGLLRDLEGTGRKRPTWLGNELANRAINGDLIQTTHSGADPIWRQEAINGIDQPLDVNTIHSFAYRDGDDHYLLLFNLDLAKTQPVDIVPAQPFSSYVQTTQLSGRSIGANNETVEEVRLAESYRTDFSATIELPPHSLTLFHWHTSDLPPLAVPDSYLVSQSGALSGDLLANDYDEAFRQVTLELLEGPASGQFSLDENGLFTYMAEEGFSGTVDGRYRITDVGGRSAEATFQFVVPGENGVTLMLPIIGNITTR